MSEDQYDRLGDAVHDAGEGCKEDEPGVRNDPSSLTGRMLTWQVQMQLSDNVVGDISVNVGQSEVTSGVSIRQPRVVESE